MFGKIFGEKIDFFDRCFFSVKNRKFLVPKNVRPKVFGFFFDEKNSIKHFGSPISIPNDPKIPKMTLRTACDHYKITKSEHEKK